MKNIFIAIAFIAASNFVNAEEIPRIEFEPNPDTTLIELCEGVRAFSEYSAVAAKNGETFSSILLKLKTSAKEQNAPYESYESHVQVLEAVFSMVESGMSTYSIGKQAYDACLGK